VSVDTPEITLCQAGFCGKPSGSPREALGLGSPRPDLSQRYPSISLNVLRYFPPRSATACLQTSTQNPALCRKSHRIHNLAQNPKAQILTKPRWGRVYPHQRPNHPTATRPREKTVKASLPAMLFNNIFDLSGRLPHPRLPIPFRRCELYHSGRRNWIR
jgi:hypothetical protein